MLWRQQRQHKLQQQQLHDHQQHVELLQQTGMDPAAAVEEAEKVAVQRAEQQQGDFAREAVAFVSSAAEKRWSRKQALSPVFGSSSAEAALQLQVVAAAGGELVEKLAGEAWAWWWDWELCC